MMKKEQRVCFGFAGLDQEHQGNQSKKINNVLSAAAAVLLALLAAGTPLAVTGCPVETEYVTEYKEVPTYPEITVPVRLVGKSIQVKCPGNLLSDSYSKIDAAIYDIEIFVETQAPLKNRLFNFLSANNDVQITVKNDGSVQDCERFESKTILVNYEWLVSTSTVANDIFDKIFIALNTMAQDNGERKSAWHQI
jgi:hypothetical protein